MVLLFLERERGEERENEVPEREAVDCLICHEVATAAARNRLAVLASPTSPVR